MINTINIKICVIILYSCYSDTNNFYYLCSLFFFQTLIIQNLDNYILNV